MRFFLPKLLAFILFFIIHHHAYAQATIKHVEFDKDQNIIISLDKKTDFKTYSLVNPERLVIDINDAEIDEDAFEHDFPSFVNAIRQGKKENSLRIVFDLDKKISIRRSSFQKVKNEEFGKIIILTDLNNTSPETKSEQPSDLQPWAKMIQNEPIKQTAAPKSEVKYVITNQTKIEKTPIIVIDAGHGGKDPGTIGDYARTKEKNVTLSYARELGKHLLNSKNYKVYLTRDSDEFIPLKERVEKARRLKADLFISLHANSASDRSAYGLSVYTLSEKSSDKQAELLAQKENRADILAGMNFTDTSGDILKILIDLSQRSTMNSSSKFANNVIKSMQKYDINILQNTHRFAGFMVLTAPDMTSVLVELGYLSNRDEESELNSLSYKRNIVKAMVDAIDEYFKIKK